MEYQPRTPKQNHNVAAVHPLKDFAVLLAGVSGIVVAIYFILGLMVDVVVDWLPDDIDDDMAFSHHLDTELSNNTEVQDWVNTLSLCAGIQSAVQVSVTDSDVVNAMALPGKQIIVFSGLLDAVSSDVGLAFVLAHELAHFKHKDHLRGLGRGVVLGGLSALLFGSNANLTEVLMPASQFGEARYSQSRERAADAAALRTVHCYFGHTQGVTELFEYYQQHQQGLWGSHYFSSHPDPQARIQELQALAQSLNYNNISP